MAGKLSRDQKRKKKLNERRRSLPQKISAYDGNTYKSPYWVMELHAAERAILEAHHESGRKLTDRQIADSLRYLVRYLRGENQKVPTYFTRQLEDGTREDVVSARILEHWDRLCAGRPLHAADAIGILRTILGSVELHMFRGGYLVFLEGFLTELAAKKPAAFSTQDILHLAEEGGLMD